MDRLTIRNKKDSIDVKLNGSMQRTYETHLWAEIFEKLAYYEDLEESGLLKKFPCKTGDTVYVVSPLYTFPKKHIHERKICRFLTIESDWYFETEMFTHKLEEFGVNVFLTREEAELKLKEINNV